MATEIFLKWTKGFLEDAKRKEFISIKVLSVLLIGGATTLFPFLTIQARSLGIKEDELGFINSIYPFIGIFVPTLAGMVADKIGNFKILLSALYVASSGASLCLLTVPQGRITHRIPDNISFHINVTEDGPENITLWDAVSCSWKNITNLDVNIKLCQENCEVSARKYSIIDLNDRGQNSKDAPYLEDTEHLHLKDTKYNFTVFYQEGFPILDGTHNSFIKTIQSTFKKESDVSCFVDCLAIFPSKHLCRSNVTVTENNASLTLVTYSVFVTLIRILSAASSALYGGGMIAILKQYGGDIGYQTIYLHIGMIVMTPLAGLWIDKASTEGHETNYGPAIYLYAGLITLSAAIVPFMDLEFKKPSPTVFKEAKKFLTNFEVICFLTSTFICGSFFGFLETFLFWLLEDLGSDKRLMGITITVGASAGIPLLIFSTPIIQKMGHVNTIIFSMSFYIIRFLGYSFLTNPWHSLAYESLECFTLALVGVAFTSYISELSNPLNIVTLQGLSTGIQWGVGRGIGSLLGGLMIHNIGIKIAFRILALVSACSCVAYFLANHFYIRKAKRRQDAVEENPSSEEKASSESSANTINIDDKLPICSE